VAAELTTSSGDDASALPDLLDRIEVPIRRFTADGAYDHRSIYDRVGVAATDDVVIVIPPRRCAVSAGSTTARGRNEKRLFRGFVRSDDESGRRSRDTDSRRALGTGSSDTSQCSEKAWRRGTATPKGERPRSGVTSSTGWPSSAEVLRRGVMNE